MENEKKTGILLTSVPASREIALTGGGVQIAASQKPIAVSLVSEPGRIYMVLDFSGSMKGVKLDHARKGIGDFARDAFKKQYVVGLIKFSSRAELLSAPVNDLAILEDKLKSLRAGGSTNLSAAIKLGREKLSGLSGRRVMVIATDGQPDNVMRSLEEADKAKDEGIEILTIGTDDADVAFLKKLASKTDLGVKVPVEQFARAIYEASSLLPGPKSIQPRQE
jgi:molecular chaperone DnaK